MVNQLSKDEIREERLRIGGGLQLEKGVVVVNHEYLDGEIPDDVKYLTKQEGIEKFNEISEGLGIPTLVNPTGYMAVDDNIYDYVKETFRDKYEDKFNKVKNGEELGNAYALEQTISRLDAKENNLVTQTMKPFLPANCKFSDLKNVRINDDMADSIDNIADSRIRMTITHALSRKLKDEGKRFKETVSEMNSHGMTFKKQLADELERPVIQNMNNKKTENSELVM